MFDFIFEDYIEDIYKPSRRKLNWIDISLITIMIILAVALFLFSMLKVNQKFIVVNYIILMLFAAVSNLYIICRLKLEKKERLKKHRERLKGLENFLKDNEYGSLYNEVAIDWLIRCAQMKIDGVTLRRLSSATKNFYQTIVYPILTLTFGIIISNVNPSEAISYALSIVLVIGVLAILIISIQNAYEIFFERDKVICEYFLSDLTYLCTQMPIKSNFVD